MEKKFEKIYLPKSLDWVSAKTAFGEYYFYVGKNRAANVDFVLED